MAHATASSSRSVDNDDNVDKHSVDNEEIIDEAVKVGEDFVRLEPLPLPLDKKENSEDYFPESDHSWETVGPSKVKKGKAKFKIRKKMIPKEKSKVEEVTKAEEFEENAEDLETETVAPPDLQTAIYREMFRGANTPKEKDKLAMTLGLMHLNNNKVQQEGFEKEMTTFALERKISTMGKDKQRDDHQYAVDKKVLKVKLVSEKKKNIELKQQLAARNECCGISSCLGCTGPPNIQSENEIEVSDSE